MTVRARDFERARVKFMGESNGLFRGIAFLITIRLCEPPHSGHSHKNCCCSGGQDKPEKPVERVHCRHYPWGVWGQMGRSEGIKSDSYLQMLLTLAGCSTEVGIIRMRSSNSGGFETDEDLRSLILWP
jgi:hypothetical protein